MALDPRKQECHGLYLYGAGYFSRDDNTLSLPATAHRHFCMTCPRSASCETEHERRVRADQPGRAELFDPRIREAGVRGYSEMVTKLFLGQRGLDPFAIVAVENFNRGHADRG